MTHLSFLTFVHSNFHIVKTSLIALLLMIIENELDSQFMCPKSSTLGICYSLVFICVPCVPLIFLHVRLSSYCTKPSVCCTGGTCFYNIFELLHPLKMPIFWVLILAIDGRYMKCFYDVGQDTSWIPIIQMIGLSATSLIFCILLIKPCDCVVEWWRKLSCVRKFYQNKHRHLLLTEVEIVVDKMLKEKREELIKAILKDKTTKMEDPDTHETVRDMIKHSKEEVKKKLKDFTHEQNNSPISTENIVDDAGELHESISLPNVSIDKSRLLKD